MTVVDRFERDYVIVRDTENDMTYSLSVTMIDKKAKVGDVLIFNTSRGLYVVDGKAIS